MNNLLKHDQHYAPHEEPQQQLHEEYDQQQFDALSSSGVESDWVLFSPLSDEELLVDKEDVLSSSTDHARDDHQLEDEEEEDDDDDSLIESLGTTMSPSLHQHQEVLQTKENTVAQRIDSWRKEQARSMINELHRHSFTSSTSASTERSSELLASWGVDDRLLTEVDEAEEDEQPKTKRFYGDDLLQGYTPWEVSKVKKMAHQLSSSLVRDHKSPPQPAITRRRSSMLLIRSTGRLLDYHSSIQQNDVFWKRDLSSAHSSLSLSTNSIMFGGLNIGEA